MLTNDHEYYIKECLKEAKKALEDNWRLEGADLYVTVEPCLMCAFALVQARVKRIIYGTKDVKAGGCGSIFDITNDSRLNHQIEVISDILKQDCQSILQEFFRKKRISESVN